MSCAPGAEFAYNDFEFKETLVTEWDAVCGKVSTHLPSYFYDEINISQYPRLQQPPMGTVQVLYILGLGAGSAVCGKLGDTLGRKPALALAILLCSAAELLGAFNSYLAGLYTYAGTRFLAGVGQQVRWPS